MSRQREENHFDGSEQRTTILDTAPPESSNRSKLLNCRWWPGVELNHRHADFQSAEMCIQEHPPSPRTIY